MSKYYQNDPGPTDPGNAIGEWPGGWLNGEWKCPVCGWSVGRNLRGHVPFALVREHKLAGCKKSRPTYAEVYQTIASNASDALVSFADKWSRFPVGSNAAFILERLQSALDWHRGFAGTVRAEVIAKLTAAIDEITLQAHGTV